MDRTFAARASLAAPPSSSSSSSLGRLDPRGSLCRSSCFASTLARNCRKKAGGCLLGSRVPPPLASQYWFHASPSCLESLCSALTRSARSSSDAFPSFRGCRSCCCCCCSGCCCCCWNAVRKRWRKLATCLVASRMPKPLASQKSFQACCPCLELTVAWTWESKSSRLFSLWRCSCSVHATAFDSFRGGTTFACGRGGTSQSSSVERKPRRKARVCLLGSRVPPPLSSQYSLHFWLVRREAL
mmetsp:Transcript_35154/g.97246  ORF Transcript_35154/g.97246 Transcript_35154/m.97246 type:complete len:242 (+) Transcript_35154:527-1252(+)